MPEVCASAPVGEMAKPNAAANPSSETILRRETNLDLSSEVMLDLLRYRVIGTLIFVFAYDADPNRIGSGSRFPIFHCGR
jgi:hypothetical protein